MFTGRLIAATGSVRGCSLFKVLTKHFLRIVLAISASFHSGWQAAHVRELHWHASPLSTPWPIGSMFATMPTRQLPVLVEERWPNVTM